MSSRHAAADRWHAHRHRTSRTPQRDFQGVPDRWPDALCQEVRLCFVCFKSNECSRDSGVQRRTVRSTTVKWSACTDWLIRSKYNYFVFCVVVQVNRGYLCFIIWWKICLNPSELLIANDQERRSCFQCFQICSRVKRWCWKARNVLSLFVVLQQKNPSVFSQQDPN